MNLNDVMKRNRELQTGASFDDRGTVTAKSGNLAVEKIAAVVRDCREELNALAKALQFGAAEAWSLGDEKQNMVVVQQEKGAVVFQGRASDRPDQLLKTVAQQCAE
jgi:hypothetical protein